MQSRMRDLIKLTGVIAVAFGLGLTAAQTLDLPRAGTAQTTTRVAGAPAVRVAGGIGRDLPSFADVVDRVNPSVVYVRTSARRRVSQQQVPPEFQDFFRRFQGPQQDQPRLQQGSGTGFITSRDGYILTNNHVVEDADQVTVTLLDNREFTARVVGRDPNTDVAVIKINADNLPAVTLGSSDGARVGDWVLAFGNPLGFTFTVTSGIVSAKGRTLAGLVDRNQARSYAIQDFIQTDAAINPGNSGGPLVNMNGEVIGINSAIASSTGFYAGYGFAIPINLARRVMDDLISKGRVDRAVLGINIVDATADDAAAVGLREIKGVLVSRFPPDGESPARAAGIELGDVIVAVNDTSVDHVAQLQQMVGFRRAGEHVRVTVVRREGSRTGVRRTFDVRLIAAETAPRVASSENGGSAEPSEQEGKLGLRVEALPAQFISQFQLTEAQQGVAVADVEEGGPSYGRIAPPDQGPDIILQVNDQRVKTLDDFKRALRAAPTGSVVQLRVLNLRQEGKPVRIANIRAR